MMNYSGIGKTNLTHPDRYNEEHQLTQLLTESSSDSNDEVAFGTLLEPQSLHNHQNPHEHDQSKNLPCQPEDNSMESNSPSLSSSYTTYVGMEQTPIRPGTKRKKQSAQNERIARKIFFGESSAGSSGSPSDSGSQNSSAGLSLSDDDSSNG